MRRVVHVGPDVYSFGGTQSVIRVIRDLSIGADEISVLPTWDGPGQVRNAALVASAAGALCRERRSTIAHFHVSNGGGWVREGTLVAVAKGRRLPVVMHLHGFDFPEFARSHPRLVGPLVRQADHVICLSAEAQTVLGELGVQASTVLANPVAIDDGAPPVDAVLPVALFAGTIGYRKGVDVLIDAWRLLLEEGIEGTCRVVGPVDDFEPPKLPQMTLEPAVHPDAMPALIREARVLLLPSRAEAMPMILTESLAAGRPFVATPVGGTREITPDQAMIVPVGDARALADAIGRYLRDPAAARAAGDAGRAHIAATRSAAVVGPQLRSIYDSL